MKHAFLTLLLVLAPAAFARAEDAPAFTRLKDVVYGRKFGTALTMDVFKPAKPNGAAVVWVVSGGWVSNPDAISPVFVTEFIKRGYTVFAVCHACQPKFAIPEIIQDIHRAVRFIRHNAKEYHIDPDRIGISGGSAGGHLSLMLGTAGLPGDEKSKDPVERESSKVQAVACFFPPTDFLNFGKDGYELNAKTAQPRFRASFLYCELDRDTRTYVPVTDEAKMREISKEISPITHVKSDTAPTCIIHGDKDDLVPLQQSQIFISKLRECKVPCDLVVKKGAGHGWPTLLNDLTTFADWFDKHLNGNGTTKPVPTTANASDKSVSAKPAASNEIASARPLASQEKRVRAKDADSNWPQFRGSRSLGTSDAANLPDAWSITENVAWKTPIPGRGWSCPIVWGDKVFLTTVVSEKPPEAAKKGLYLGGDRKTPPTDPHKWMLVCLDLKTGKKLWEQVAADGVPDSSRHIKNSYASETPVTDGERVYAYFGNQGLFCYDLSGKQLWSKKLGTFRTKLGWGTAASPVLHKDRLIVVHDNEDDSFMVALDAKTGNELWRVRREEKSNWATPFVWENELRTELVTNGTGKVRSYDLDGKLLWELAGMSTITIPTPFAAHGMLYLASGYVMHNHRPVYAIRPGAAGDVSLKKDELKNEYVVWYQKLAAPYNPSPLVYGNYFYVLKDRGMFSCFDAKTGAEVYKEQRLGSGEFTASPWAYNNKVFCLSESGDTFVIQAGPEFKILGRNKLDELCMATPAIAGDRLLIRTESQLYCIKK